MKLRTSACIILAALMTLAACSPGRPSASPALQVAATSAKATPKDPSFFMTIPFNPTGKQVLEIRPVETAFMSIATMEADLPLESWTDLGWAMGKTLGQTDKVPQDCALHFRVGMDHQIYAACSGPAEVAIPHEGGDFVYIVFTDTNNRIARVMQAGSQYNPDATGLIP
jgi:hypothetical protein